MSAPLREMRERRGRSADDLLDGRPDSGEVSAAQTEQHADRRRDVGEGDVARRAATPRERTRAPNAMTNVRADVRLNAP